MDRARRQRGTAVDNVISMEAHRRSRGAAGRAPARVRPAVSFAFDLASPHTYLAAERVDRIFPGVAWVPVLGWTGPGGSGVGERAQGRERAAARARAAELRLPLVWPEHPMVGVGAMRIAQHALAAGRAGAFVLAASRLAFCGGFDLDEPENLAEAAAAAGLNVDAALAAARTTVLDGVMRAAGQRLVAQGVDRLPVVRVGRLLFAGEEHLPEAAAASRAGHGARAAHAGPWAHHPVA